MSNVKKEVKKASLIVLKPSIKKMAQKLAKKHGVSFSELVAQSLLRVEQESEFVKECVANGELTQVEADIKFRNEWGL
jgi:hypothetical protein